MEPNTTLSKYLNYREGLPKESARKIYKGTSILRSPCTKWSLQYSNDLVTVVKSSKTTIFNGSMFDYDVNDCRVV